MEGGIANKERTKQTEKSAGQPSSQGRVSRALDHVRKLWMPVNRTVFDRIKKNLETGAYDNNRDQLIVDLRLDMALFTWCLRSLTEREKQRGELDVGFDPIIHLRSVELSQLKSILLVDPAEITTHDIHDSDVLQSQLLRDVFLSASAAQVLSEKQGKDADRAFGAALLRQIGMALVAWNYPSVMQEASLKAKEGLELEVEISKKLGFSPSLLALELVRDWGISAKKCLSLGLHVTPEEIAAAEAAANTPEEEAEMSESQYLREILEIGETLAQANNPTTYPTVRDRWTDLEIKIKSALGPSGMARIRDRFEANFQEYSRLLPKPPRSDDAPLFDTRRVPHSPEAQRAIKRNKFIEECESGVKVRLQTFYGEMQNAPKIERDLLRKLLTDIVTLAGFSAGCVFTHDPALSSLVPQMKIGTPKAIPPEPVDCKFATPESPIVVSAFHSIAPITKVISLSDNQLMLCVVGYFGRRARFGVMCLEQPIQTVSKDGDVVPLRHFQAICRALNDCLNL